MSATVTLLPLPFAQRLGRALGALISALAPRLHPQADAQLKARLARLEADEPVEMLAREAWRDLGQRALEWLLGRRALRLVRLSPEVKAWCAEQRGAEERGERWVCLTAHFGHWELMGGALSAEGASFVAAAARERNGVMSRWLRAHRASLGVETMSPTRARGALRRFLKKGGVRAFLIDQPSRDGRARRLSFLGAPAPTLTLPSELIERARALGVTRVLWLYAVRVEGVYEVRGVELSEVGDPVARATELLERLVLEHPTQWLWLIERWVYTSEL